MLYSSDWLKDPYEWSKNKSGCVFVEKDDEEGAKAVLYYDESANVVEEFEVQMTPDDEKRTFIKIFVSDMHLAYKVLGSFMYHAMYKSLRGY